MDKQTIKASGKNEFIVTMTKLKFSQRKLMQRFFQISSVILGTGFIGGCGREEDASAKREQNGELAGFGDHCDDLSHVNRSEIAKRDIYGYVEKTPYPEYRCDNCSLYIPSEVGEECGGCVLFEGPVYAGGYCDYWAPEA